jgi:hypothetical protein
VAVLVLVLVFGLVTLVVVSRDDFLVWLAADAKSGALDNENSSKKSSNFFKVSTSQQQ